ncbi:MobF family relaxase [Streptomyces sp. NPDC048629]|uniref:MobF family relaxase n=1 Tax=Streptomyces sp. NPDC048629 TaxID=3154824 RepID=UPI00343E5BD7
MAWATVVVDDEQVEYRLTEHAGCYVQFDGDGTAQTPGGGADRSVGHRLDRDEDGALVWIGEGLRDVGLTAGMPLDAVGKQAARALSRGVHPSAGAQLVEPVLRAHPRAKLAGAPLLDVLDASAAAAGMDSGAGLFDGKPKQRAAYERLARMVHQKGERHCLQVDTLHRLARAAGLRLDDVYGAEELAQALAHSKERVNVRVRAYDVVADLNKSFSTLWALLQAHDEKALRGLVHEAKREAFAELERWIGYGVAGEDGELHRIATGGLLGWSLEHQSARPVDDTPGDPHLHLHLVITNLARCEDGRWRAIANGGMDLHRHLRAFDGLFKARLRALAAERFGVRYERDTRTGAWEIVGIPAELRAHYSRRAAQVDAIAGADASREEKLRVSAQTRHAKHDTGDIDLRAVWRGRAEGLGIDVDAMVAAAAPGSGGPSAGGLNMGGPEGPRTPSPQQIAAEVFDPRKGLTAHEKEFSHAQLLAAVANACPYGLDVSELEPLAQRVLAVEGYARALPPRGSTLMSNTARYTTQDVLDAEQTIVDQATTRFDDGSARLAPEQAEAALGIFEVSAGFALGPEQRRAVVRLLTAGHGVDALIGVAGSGKTSLMQACRIGWDATGLTYAGAALAAVAADNLAESAGIPSRTLASWLQRIESGVGLRGLDVLVIDEAAMTDDRALAVLFAEAARTGTKIIGVGDPHQLRAIGPGGGFAEVHRIVSGQTLTANRRQRDPSEREALEAWRTGPTGRERALTVLADSGRVHATDTADQAHEEILAAWDQTRSRWPDAHDAIAALVVLAARNTDVDTLNRGAQRIRRDAGELGDAHTYAQPGGDRLTLAVGDFVRVRVNDHRSRRGGGPDVLNGYRAVITAIDADHCVQIAWRRTDADAHHRYEHAWLTPHQIADGALSLGYAMTVAASQGLTAEVSLLYGLGADSFSLYPGITRARAENHLWLPTQALEDAQTRAELGEPADEAETLERALNAYTTLLRQDRPDGMILDQIRATPEPLTPAADEPTAAFPRWNDRVSRPHGTLPLAQLATRADDADHRALESEDAAAAYELRAVETATELAAVPSPGQRTATGAAAVLHKAEELAHHARQAAARAEQADTDAAKAREIKETLERSTHRGRLTLWLAGSSRSEQHRFLAEHTMAEARAIASARQARNAAEQARRKAWQTLQNSPYAELFHAHGPVAGNPTVAQMTQSCDRIRAALPEIAEQIDTRRAEDVRSARTQAVELRERATSLRAAAAGLRAEHELRRRIAEQSPELHAQESAARDQALRQARPTAALQQANNQRQVITQPPEGGPTLRA